MFDLIIRGGDVVTPEGVVRCDVAVAGETIAAIATPGALPADSAKQLIDATGRIVMPGGIDPHVHLHHVGLRKRAENSDGLCRNFLAIRRRSSLISGTG
jgi:dihydroorotase-like cyclic amidohydrolase